MHTPVSMVFTKFLKTKYGRRRKFIVVNCEKSRLRLNLAVEKDYNSMFLNVCNI